jgi:hypothetical protein
MNSSNNEAQNEPIVVLALTTRQADVLESLLHETLSEPPGAKRERPGDHVGASKREAGALFKLLVAEHESALSRSRIVSQFM